MPKISDPRERMANQLLRRGSATPDEIFEASFGEWPPKGLDIVGENNQRISLVSLMSFKMQNPGVMDYVMKFSGLGNATSTMSGERQVAMNRFTTRVLPALFGQSIQNEVLGHEAVHVLQGDHYYRAQEVFGAEAAQVIWTEQKGTKGEAIVSEVFAAHAAPRGIKSILTALQTSGMTSSYQNGDEMQAYMHTILSRGYPGWGKLPQNREELWTALSDVGLKPPQDILDQMEKSPTIGETRKVFSRDMGRGFAHNSISKIAIGSRGLTPEGRTMFWETTLPALYSDLIEMYGDRLGRERFGLGHNERAGFREAAQQAAIAVTAPLSTVAPGADILPPVTPAVLPAAHGPYVWKR